MKKNFLYLFFIFYFFLFTFNSYATTIPSQLSLINDNSENNLNENERLYNILNNFKENQNIDVYIYICKPNSTVTIDEIVNNYKQNISNNYLLFYIDISQGNIAIYNSDDLISLISDSDKILMLSSMQNVLSSQDTINNKIIDSIDISLNNLSKLINIKKTNNNMISNEILNIDEIQQNSNIYKYTMIFSAFILLIGFFFLFKKK